MMSAIFSATPAFFTKVARAPPIPVTMMGIAAETIPSSTQLLRTFLVFHSLPVRSSARMQPVKRAARGLPMKAQKLATPVSGSTTEVMVFRRIRNRGNRMGSSDLVRLGRGWFSISLAERMNSSLGATGVFRVMQ